jgi:hypothetical protein
MFQVIFLPQQVNVDSCNPRDDWNSESREIGSCPAGSKSPNFVGCPDSSNLFSDFDNQVNSVDLFEVVRDESKYRCVQLENLIKNGSAPFRMCKSDANNFRENFELANTYLIKLFTCSNGSSSGDAYAGCYPVKRSVRQHTIICRVIFLNFPGR